MAETSSGGTDRASPLDDPAAEARSLVRRALKGALATLDRLTGHPYASLVTLATEPAGAPVFLISCLALHTQNLAADERASVLVDATGNDGNPLAGGRVTLIGRAVPATSQAARSRFLARHPEAEGYAGFGDFSFFELDVERAHFVGGFGRIVALERSGVLLEPSACQAVAEAEADILEHMNTDHAGAIELYATRLLGADGGPWRLSGVDPEGCDIVCPGQALRLPFESMATSPAAIRREFTRLAGLARTRGAQG